MVELKTGDPCPCCGQPIRWRNPRILRLLTYAAAGELTRLGLEELLELTKQETDHFREVTKMEG